VRRGFRKYLSTHEDVFSVVIAPEPTDETRRLTSPYVDVLNIHAWRRDTGTMRTPCAVVTVILGIGVISARPARAQVSVQIAVPTIRFEVAPALVVVSPGVQVVPEYEEEVFFVDGWYWYRSGPYWYRTRDHRGGWVFVERRYVPMTLVKIPPGRYKHYKAKGLPPGQAKKLERERVVPTPYGPAVVRERERHGDGEGREHGHEGNQNGHQGKEHGHGRWKDGKD